MERTMSETEECASMGKVEKALTLGRPVPGELVQYVRECEQCLFWLSWGMAAKRAIFSTDRLRFPDCPMAHEVSYGLLVAARSIKTSGGLINRESMKRFQHTSAAELALTLNLRTHIDTCELCMAYWEELIARMIDEQKEYEHLLTTGGTPSPVIADTAEEREIPRFSFVGTRPHS